MARDPHRRHQQLLTELNLLNIRIRGYEKHMKEKKGKIPSRDWENLVRELKTLNTRKSELNRKIRELK